MLPIGVMEHLSEAFMTLRDFDHDIWIHSIQGAENCPCWGRRDSVWHERLIGGFL